MFNVFLLYIRIIACPNPKNPRTFAGLKIIGHDREAEVAHGTPRRVEEVSLT